MLRKIWNIDSDTQFWVMFVASLLSFIGEGALIWKFGYKSLPSNPLVVWAAGVPLGLSIFWSLLKWQRDGGDSWSDAFAGAMMFAGVAVITWIAVAPLIFVAAIIRRHSARPPSDTSPRDELARRRARRTHERGKNGWHRIIATFAST